MPNKNTNLKKKTAKLSIQKEGGSASPFVVDLKKQHKPIAIKEKREERLKNYLYDYIEKEAEKKQQPGEPKKRLNFKFNFKPNLKKLAVFNLLSLFYWLAVQVGKLFYRFCFGLGWLAVFAVKFFYILISALAKKLIEMVKSVLGYFYKTVVAFKPKPRATSKKVVAPKPKPILEPLEPLVAPLVALENKNFLYRLKPLLAFVFVLIILVLPIKLLAYYKSLDTLKTGVIGNTNEAVMKLIAAGKSAAGMDFNAASSDFSQAGSNFLQAQKQLSEINNLLLALAGLAPNKELKLAADSKHILAAGSEAASLGQNLSLAVKALVERQDQELLLSLEQFESYSRAAIADAQALNRDLDQINSEALPTEYQEQFIAMRAKATFLEKSLSEFTNLIGKLKIFLGAEQDRRYLLIFQNNAELRATGGFFGSFALVDFSKGKIKNIETPGGGSYDTEGGLRERIIAPKPLHLLNPLWHFWDSNWWPDWTTSAKKIMWFYEKSNGPTVDGVISLTPTVLEEFLRATGPIDMTEKYNTTIDADNLWLTLQTFSEQKPDQTKEPKKIVGDLLNKIVAELPARLDRNMIFSLIKATEKSLNEKQLLFYFKDKELQQAIENYGWDGRIKETKWDYLSVINTNIGGAKTDRKIKEIISHQAEVMADGSIINTVEISRTHTGIKNEAFSGVRNVDWMRIYVPKGSELIEARGFVAPPHEYFEVPDQSWKQDPDLENESVGRRDPITNSLIYEEAGKTVFANWTMVDPGQTATIYLRYKLPFGFKKEEHNQGLRDQISALINPAQKELYPYALLVQKQAGAQASEFKSRLITPGTDNRLTPIWNYPDSKGGAFEINQTGWEINDRLETDKYWAVFLER